MPFVVTDDATTLSDKIVEIEEIEASFGRKYDVRFLWLVEQNEVLGMLQKVLLLEVQQKTNSGATHTNSGHFGHLEQLGNALVGNELLVHSNRYEAN